LETGKLNQLIQIKETQQKSREKSISKQRKHGKLTAMERIESLLDEDSFVEVDSFITHRCHHFGMQDNVPPGDGVITGYGTVDGRLVFVYAQDFTMLGGSLGEMHAKKIVKVQAMALKAGAPIIGINDSGGARIQEGVDALQGYGDIFYQNIMASGAIPQLSIILGPCAGGASYSPALTDFIFMVKDVSKMFITGPQVIKSVTGENLSAEALGGAMTHNRISGVAHFYDEDEAGCFDRIKLLLSHLPSNNLETAPMTEAFRAANERISFLNEIVPEAPNKSYDMMTVINALIDEPFLAYQPYFAENIITGFGRIQGHSVGIIGNQPAKLAGCLDINASDKAAQFVRTCDVFNIPLITLMDTPGFLPGTQQEYGGIIRHGAKLLYAYAEATVPKITIITRKAYGGSYIAMCSKALGADLVLAWPTAEVAVMGAAGAANIIFRKEIEAAEDVEAMRQEKIEEYTETILNPYLAAARGQVDDVIVPEETRMRIISALNMTQGKRESRPQKKHGRIPL
jgi:acetyl-CoA carboxylase carboxyltransferase component